MALLNAAGSIWDGFVNALGFIWDQAYHLAQKVGLGGGVGVLAFLRYMKPPSVNANWVLCAAFDAICHVTGNGRSGERTAADGKTVIWLPPARREPPPEQDTTHSAPSNEAAKQEVPGKSKVTID
jgi:hypothetical protein